jgi:hypothetical protein
LGIEKTEFIKVGLYDGYQSQRTYVMLELSFVGQDVVEMMMYIHFPWHVSFGV